MMQYLSIFMLLFLFACETDSEELPLEHNDVIEVPEVIVDQDTSAVFDDTVVVQEKQQKIYDEEVASIEILKESEIGSTDDKFNGEEVLIQMVLSQDEYTTNPQLVYNEVRANYEYSKNFFPTDSRGKVSSITLNYRIELFEDDKAKVPYKVFPVSWGPDSR